MQKDDVPNIKCKECGAEMKHLQIKSDDSNYTEDFKREFRDSTLLICPKCNYIAEITKDSYVVHKDGLIWSHRLGLRNLAAEGQENGVRRFIRDRVKNKHSFLDVGANVGLHCVNLAKDFLYSVAIEPHPLNVKLLRETLELNSIKNVFVFQLAAWNKPCVLKLQRLFPDGADGWIFTTEEKLKCDDELDIVEIIDVPGIPLDNLNLPVSCIKIDVEGSEFHVVAGLTRTLSIARPVLIIENHKVFTTDNESMNKYIKELGYEHHVILAEDKDRSMDVYWSGNSVEDFKVEDYSNDILETGEFGRIERLVSLRGIVK